MNCQEARRFISPYLDSELGQTKTFEVSEHLSECESCRRRFEQERSAQIKTYGDLIRRHRDEHAIDWLKSAVDMAMQTGDVELVLQRFLRLETLPV